ncbi:MAG: ParB/RepB/Spo0J family partition protein [Candidatus Njordarchaeales archaeon]
MSTVVLRGRVERVVERGKWVLVYLEDRLTPIAFPADADYIPKEGEVVEGRARRGNSWLFARPGWQIISVESKPSKDAKYLELPLSKLTLHPIHVELGRQANEELIENIKAQGILEPLIVRKVGDYYEVLAGSRRLDAAKKAGLTKVPCRIIEADDKKLIALWENVHKEDLGQISLAKALKFMIENYNLTNEKPSVSLVLLIQKTLQNPRNSIGFFHSEKLGKGGSGGWI